MGVTLTAREWEYLRHRANGLTIIETARRMGCAESTAKMYLTRVHQKTGAQCLEDALRAVGWLRVPAA